MTIRAKIEQLIQDLQAQLPNADKVDASAASARGKAGTELRGAAQAGKAVLDDLRKDVLAQRESDQ